MDIKNLKIGNIPKKHENGRRLANPLLWVSGFTLLEVMVALAVIATVLISVYQLHTQSLSLALETRFHSYAPFLAQQKLAELTSGKVASLESGSGDFGEDYPGVHWELVVEPVESDFTKTVPIHLVRIDITVFDSGEEYHYTTRTYRWVES
jgi:general secretion pathway protein I